MTPLPLMLIVWALMRWHVLWRAGWQHALNMTHPTDIEWTANSTLTYPAIVITGELEAGDLSQNLWLGRVGCNTRRHNTGTA